MLWSPESPESILSALDWAQADLAERRRKLEHAESAEGVLSAANQAVLGISNTLRQLAADADPKVAKILGVKPGWGRPFLAEISPGLLKLETLLGAAQRQLQGLVEFRRARLAEAHANLGELQEAVVGPSEVLENLEVE